MGRLPGCGDVRSPANPVDTWVTSMIDMFQHCLFYYYGLKIFRDKIQSDSDQCDGPNPKLDDKLYVAIFDAILKREGRSVHRMEFTASQLASYAKNEVQMNRVMASWIVFLRHKTSKSISSTKFQVISFEKKLHYIDSYKKSICRRVQVKIDELNDMTPKCGKASCAQC